MVRLFKLVALVLMLVMGTLPLLASASPSCRMMTSPANPAPSIHRCCPSMTMMAEVAAPLHALEAGDAMPCCHVVPAKPVRAVELQMPATSAELALQPADAAVSAAPVTTHARCDYHVPLPDSASIQSQLCTFLI